MHQKYIVAMPNTFLVIKPKTLFFNNNSFPIIIVIIYIFYVLCSEAFFFQLSFSQEFTKMRGFYFPLFSSAYQRRNEGKEIVKLDEVLKYSQNRHPPFQNLKI